jgi:hypothetical protein
MSVNVTKVVKMAPTEMIGKVNLNFLDATKTKLADTPTRSYLGVSPTNSR